eukprot:588543-Pyramimonas_sp.AAC.1
MAGATAPNCATISPSGCNSMSCMKPVARASPASTVWTTCASCEQHPSRCSTLGARYRQICSLASQGGNRT